MTGLLAKSLFTAAIDPALIDDSDRLRPISEAGAALMAASIEKDGGQIQAIMVRPARPPEVREGCEFALVVGGHRLAGCRLLGRKVKADVFDLTRAEARIIEVDENLHRVELTQLDRSIFLLASKQAHEEVYPETAHGGDRKSRKSKDEIKWQSLPLDRKRFTEVFAERLDLGERSIRAAIALAAALSPDAIAALRASGIADNFSELKSFASHSPETQEHFATLLAKGEARDVKGLRIAAGLDVPPAIDAQEVLFNKLVELYGRANQRTKRRFEEHAGLVFGNQVRAG